MAEWIPPTNITEEINNWLRQADSKTLREVEILAFEIYNQRGGVSTDHQKNTDLRSAAEIIMQRRNRI